MPAPIVWIFIIISSTFASVHNFATAASLYWYIPWFDIVMHFWGGMLIALGVAALSTFKLIPLKPTFLLTTIVLLVAMVLWEIFEYVARLYQPAMYALDTCKDMLVGFSGGVTGYLIVKSFKK